MVFTPPVRRRIAAVADCVAISAACEVISAASGPYLTQGAHFSRVLRKRQGVQISSLRFRLLLMVYAEGLGNPGRSTVGSARDAMQEQAKDYMPTFSLGSKTLAHGTVLGGWLTCGRQYLTQLCCRSPKPAAQQLPWSCRSPQLRRARQRLSPEQHLSAVARPPAHQKVKLGIHLITQQMTRRVQVQAAAQ